MRRKQLTTMMTAAAAKRRMRRRDYYTGSPPLTTRQRHPPLRLASFSATSITTPPPLEAAFVDPALIWGRNNPKVAEQCLLIPPLPPLPEDSTTKSNAFQTIHSLPDYLKWRQWKVLDNNGDNCDTDLALGQALVSHVLSAPLTVASFHRSLLLAQQQQQQQQQQRSNTSKSKWNESTTIAANTTDVEQQQTQQPHKFHWCCVGARAEATLPHGFWKEYLVAVSHLDHDDDDDDASSRRPPNQQQQQQLDITIDFVGPDIHPQIPPTTLTYGNHSKLHLNWLYRGFLHDYVAAAAAATPDAASSRGWTGYILLNPGIGHDNLKENWKPTLDFLLNEQQQQQLPILMTSHSDLDAQRDYQVLNDDYDMDMDMDIVLEHTKDDVSAAPSASINPFASMVTYEDPFDATHKVQPNHSVLILPPAAGFE